MNYNNFFVDYELPAPLSESELYECFKKYKSGDKMVRNFIILHNIKLVISRVIKKFSNVPCDKKELVSIGLVGLIKSVDTFDISRNIKFSTYASKCVDNEILMFIRKQKKYLNMDSIYETIMTSEDGKQKNLEDVLPDENANFLDYYDKKESYEIIRNVIEDLKERDKCIIKLYFGFIDNKLYKQEEIANKLGISQAYVSRVLARVLKIIKLKLEREGVIETSSKIKKHI